MKKLLKDVMMDACKKMQEVEVSEMLFLTILKMMEYLELVIEEGTLALAIPLEEEGLAQELKEIFAIPFGMELILVGEERIMEVLTTKYWVNNPQGIYAMANYIVMRAWQALLYEEKECRWVNIERLLTACLPDGNEERYKKYKAEYFPKYVPKPNTPKEELI